MSTLKSIVQKNIDRGAAFFRTDLHYILRGGFWLTLAKIVTGASSFISSIVFANIVPKEVYGLYRFVLSYLSILTLPTLAGIDTSLTKSVGRGYHGSIVPAFFAKVRFGLLAGCASLGFAGYYFFQGDHALALCFFISAFFLPILDPLQLYMAYWNGKRDYIRYAKYHTILKAVVTVLLIGTMFLTQNLILIVLSYLVSYTLLRLVFFLVTVKQIQPTEDFDPAIISYGKNLTLMSVLGTIAEALDKILIFHFLGAAELATYFLALVPTKQIWSFLGTFNMLALPKFSGGKIHELRSSLPIKVLKSYLVVVPVVLAYITIAPILFRVFYPQYVNAILPSQLSILVVLFFPATFLTTALTSQSQTNKLYISSTAFSSIRIALLLIIVPRFGMYGAIAASLGTNVLNLAITSYLFMKMKE